ANHHIENDHVQQSEDFGGWHVTPRDLEHVGHSGSADARLIGFVLRAWRQAERLTVILLVQSPPTPAYFDAIISLHQEMGSIARTAASAGCRWMPIITVQKRPAAIHCVWG